MKTRNHVLAAIAVVIALGGMVVHVVLMHQSHGTCINEKPIVVVIPSYNNAEWYQRNLSSVFAQRYSNYRVIYTDDCSTDNTAQLVADYIKQLGQEHRTTLIRNTTRRGALANLYDMIHSCEDHCIIVTVDGDDWVKDDYVFSRLNHAYQNPNVWMTYGQFERYPSGMLGYCEAMPDVVISYAAYRRFKWLSTHLRTFYAGLFKRIKKEDLMHEGSFYMVTWDMAMMFPMLEMAGGHYAFIPEVMYVWNEATQINDYKVRLPEVLACERIIRAKVPYDSLKEASWIT